METSEWQKMLDGELYDPRSSEHFELRQKGRRQQRLFNDSTEEGWKYRKQILKEWLGSCPDMINIDPPLYMDYGCNVHVGKYFYANVGCVILDCAKVTIGNSVLFGPKVQIYTAVHPLEAHERIKGPVRAESVTIGDNCWLGGGCIICPGVTIGDNTTIGAGSVVTKSIPANVLAAGNPARVLKQLPLPPPST